MECVSLGEFGRKNSAQEIIRQEVGVSDGIEADSQETNGPRVTQKKTTNTAKKDDRQFQYLSFFCTS